MPGHVRPLASKHDDIFSPPRRQDQSEARVRVELTQDMTPDLGLQARCVTVPPSRPELYSGFAALKQFICLFLSYSKHYVFQTESPKAYNSVFPFTMEEEGEDPGEKGPTERSPRRASRPWRPPFVSMPTTRRRTRPERSINPPWPSVALAFCLRVEKRDRLPVGPRPQRQATPAPLSPGNWLTGAVKRGAFLLDFRGPFPLPDGAPPLRFLRHPCR